MEQNVADQVEITYYTDPLCCWSWAMEPQWRRFRFEFKEHISWKYCMGGLLPTWKNFTDSLHSISRPAQMGPLWMEAAHLSGMPVHNQVWAFNPPASSYPACIAVKCAGLQSFDTEENYLRLLREAIMLHGKNIADTPMLIEIANELNNITPFLLNIEEFTKDVQGKRGRDLLRIDLEDVRLRNIRRFPTVLFRRRGKPTLSLQGYRPYNIWLQIMNQIAPDCNPQSITDPDQYQNYWLHVLDREETEIKNTHNSI